MSFMQKPGIFTVFFSDWFSWTNFKKKTEKFFNISVFCDFFQRYESLCQTFLNKDFVKIFFGVILISFGEPAYLFLFFHFPLFCIVYRKKGNKRNETFYSLFLAKISNTEFLRHFLSSLFLTFFWVGSS